MTPTTYTPPPAPLRFTGGSDPTLTLSDGSTWRGPGVLEAVATLAGHRAAGDTSELALEIAARHTAIAACELLTAGRTDHGHRVAQLAVALRDEQRRHEQACPCREVGPLLTGPGTSGRSWRCSDCGHVWTHEEAL